MSPRKGRERNPFASLLALLRRFASPRFACRAPHSPTCPRARSVFLSVLFPLPADAGYPRHLAARECEAWPVPEKRPPPYALLYSESHSCLYDFICRAFQREYSSALLRAALSPPPPTALRRTASPRTPPRPAPHRTASHPVRCADDIVFYMLPNYFLVPPSRSTIRPSSILAIVCETTRIRDGEDP